MPNYNRKLAKVDENGNLVYAPVPIYIDGMPFWINEQAEEYKEYENQGWYPIEKTEMPTKEGFYYIFYWVYDEENKVCREEWEEHEILDEPMGEVATEEDIQNAIAEGVNSIDN